MAEKDDSRKFSPGVKAETGASAEKLIRKRYEIIQLLFFWKIPSVHWMGITQRYEYYSQSCYSSDDRSAREG